MMEYRVHKAGNRQQRPATLLAAFPDYAAALAYYWAEPEAWAIVPAGEAWELAPFGNLDSIVPRYDLGTNGRGLFCVNCGEGYSTLGFGYAARKVETVRAWLVDCGQPVAPVLLPELGSPAAYLLYVATMAAGAAYNRETGARCPAELEPQLRGLEGKRVEVETASGETRRFIAGKSTGWLPCHLEIKTRRSSGGESVWGGPFKRVTVIAESGK